MKKISTSVGGRAKWITLIIFLIIIQGVPAAACDACKKQQPKLLQGITHGPSPDSNWDYVIVIGMICLTSYILVATVKCIFRPSEKDELHIKRIILNDSRR